MSPNPTKSGSNEARVGAGEGVPTKPLAGAGENVGDTVGADVSAPVGRDVGEPVGEDDSVPHAARPTVAIAAPMTVVSFITALAPRLRQRDVGREHPEGAYRRGG